MHDHIIQIWTFALTWTSECQPETACALYRLSSNAF